MPFGFIVVDPWLPPTGLAMAALLALLLWPRRARAVALLLLLPLCALSTPYVSLALLASLDPAPAAGSGVVPDAIVILSADTVRSEGVAEADVGPLTLERERAGAALARRTGLPVLVTGGVLSDQPALGRMMASSLRADFGLEVRWVEDRSATTWENATFSAAMLKAAGVSRVYVVTHGWHMRRALLAFRRAGLEVVAAPVRVDPWPRWDWTALIPRGTDWQRSFFAVHEWVGLLFYSLRA